MSKSTPFRYFLLFAFSALSITYASPALAYGTPMQSVICYVAGWFLNGYLGRGLASLAIISLGVAAVMGKVSLGMAVTAVLGITIMYMAPGLAQMFTGSSGC